MKKFITALLTSAIVYLFLPGTDSAALDLNTSPHHPERVLIMFAADSPVLAELNTHQKALKTQLPSQKPSKMMAFTADQASVIPKTGSFLESQGLISLQKLVRSGDIKKRHDQGLSTARERMYVGIVNDPDDLMQIIEQLLAHPEISSAEPDFIGHGSGQRGPTGNSPETWNQLERPSSSSFPNDRLFRMQWGLENTGQIIGQTSGVLGEDINIIPAWGITTGSSDITMAVLDSGQPDVVPDFFGRVVPGYNFVSDTTSTVDDHGHGTNVASIALATGDNNGTMAGIDWSAMIMPIKILDENNSGLYSWWIEGIYWALDAGADVMNMSVGGSSQSTMLRKAVEDVIDAGVHLVACMMNTNNDVTFYPAAYEGVVSVGAINNTGALAVPFCWGGGSNYGDHIDLVAPGDLILGLSHANPENGSYWCGTSQAAPMVAGTVSLMLSIDPDLSPAQTKEILRETARGDGWNRYSGTGVLDAHAAIARVMENRETRADTDVAMEIRLAQNYPNPFNPATTITYHLPEQSHVTLSIYTVDGRRVTVLVDEVKAAGTHFSPFDASDLGSGIYLYEMAAAGKRFVRQMTLVK